ncbi:hypothetical protein HZH68_006387 [Vespula germanica]|uniref:Uncharacterized protein n=1 Tax=Vespula germanica TaxID=30212 RepID=A0A834NDM2_VESGE|nr:hypothetical protein HZH68_006387 [Vespula germanica]
MKEEKLSDGPLLQGVSKYEEVLDSTRRFREAIIAQGRPYTLALTCRNFIDYLNYERPRQKGKLALVSTGSFTVRSNQSNLRRLENEKFIESEGMPLAMIRSNTMSREIACFARYALKMLNQVAEEEKKNEKEEEKEEEEEKGEEEEEEKEESFHDESSNRTISRFER